jgi:hypothetical protein
MKLTAIVVTAVLAIVPQIGSATAQDRGRQVERSRDGGQPLILRRDRDQRGVRDQRVQRQQVAPRRQQATPRRNVAPPRVVRPRQQARPRTVIRVQPQYRRWRPGAPRVVIAVPSIAVGARIGWCHYHRFSAHGWRAHRDVRCHRHRPWNGRGIAYVGIR